MGLDPYGDVTVTAVVVLTGTEKVLDKMRGRVAGYLNLFG